MAAMPPCATRHGGLHEFAAILHQVHRALEIQVFRRHQRAPFSETMPGHHRRLSAAAFAPEPIGGDTRGQHRRLSAFGRIEQLGRAFLTSLPEIVSEHGACLGKGSRNDRRDLRQAAHHADGLRGLAGKYEGERHVCFYP